MRRLTRGTKVESEIPFGEGKAIVRPSQNSDAQQGQSASGDQLLRRKVGNYLSEIAHRLSQNVSWRIHGSARRPFDVIHV